MVSLFWEETVGVFPTKDTDGKASVWLEEMVGLQLLRILGDNEATANEGDGLEEAEPSTPIAPKVAL